MFNEQEVSTKQTELQEQVQPVQILTVKEIHPLYKDDEPANAIELINLEEVGFDLVAQKGLYNVGDKVVYIQPDFCLSEIELFESFIRPINRKTGKPDENSSMLGKVGGKPRRIRAKKFNLSKDPGGEPVYSNGIMLPLEIVQAYGQSKEVDFDIYETDLTEFLSITKYEEPENVFRGVNTTGKKKQWPEYIYKTDETNVMNVINKLEFPIELIGTEKVDGSSITLGCIKLEEFIGSRNIVKSVTTRKHVGRRQKTFFEKLCFWTKPDLNLYEESFNSEDDFVRYGFPYAEKFISNKTSEIVNDVLLRGELNGSHLKGSGNKLNPARLEKPNIKFFGLDYINKEGFAVKQSYEEFQEFLQAMNSIQDDVVFEQVKEVFNQEFTSKEHLLETCKTYFKDHMIEGIVIQTPDAKFSAKVMNDEYDSKK